MWNKADSWVDTKTVCGTYTHSVLVSDWRVPNLLRAVPINAIGKSVASSLFLLCYQLHPSVMLSLCMGSLCSFWLLWSSACSPVLSSLLFKYGEAVGINTGKCRANWQKESLTSCASTLRYRVIYTTGTLKRGLKRYSSREKFKLTSCHTAGICAKWNRGITSLLPSTQNDSINWTLI